MKWEEVRKSYPNKYVKLQELKSHVENNKKYVDEVAVIQIIDNPKEATKELVRCKGDVFIYHTGSEIIEMEIVKKPNYKGNSYGN